MINIEIWASGSGTNADEILKYFSNHDDIDVRSLGCNRREAGAFDVAKKHNVQSVYWSKASWNPFTILSGLASRSIDYIVLAGFLKLVPKEVTQHYSGRMVNIHPSLLPAYGGKDMYGEYVHRAVLSNREKVTGITIHEVNERFDEGKVLAQYTTMLDPDIETMTSIQGKIQQLEHQNFAPTIDAWIRSNL